MFKRGIAVAAVLCLFLGHSPLFAQITWGFTYSDTAGTGFNATNTVAGETQTVGALRKGSLTAATVYLNTILDGRGTINLNLDISDNSTATNTLASFGPQQFANILGTFQNGGLYQGARTNALPFSGVAGGGQFNFGYDWNYAGQQNTASDSAIDMVTVAIHELAHGLGFLSATNSSGGGLTNNAANTVGIYSGFDRFLQRGNGPLATSALFNTDRTSTGYGTFTGNVATLTGGTNTTTGLFFGGQYTREVFGGAAPLYAPNPYEPGSSNSHVDDIDAVMNPSVDFNTVKRFKPYEIAILIDMGWNTFNWNSSTGNFADGASALASSRWTSDSGIVRNSSNTQNSSNRYNYNAFQGEAPILPIHGQVGANNILNFRGSGTQNYTATNDIASVRLARLNLNSTSSNTITIAGGSFNFGQNSDGSPSVLVPKIVQQNTGAYTISSAIQTNTIATQFVGAVTAPGINYPGVSFPGFSGLTVDGTGSGQVSLTGGITGNGGLTKAGSFTLVVSAANAYTGTTTVSAGTLQIGSGGTTGQVGTGAVTNNSAIVFNRSNDASIANVISGTGTFAKQGAGILTLTGANAYSGATTITTGTLLANNTASSATGTGAVTVATSATLGGTGSATGAITVNNGGFLRAGTGGAGADRSLNTGALTVNGRYIATLFGTNASGDVSQLVTTGNLNLNSATDSIAIDLSGVTVANLRTAVGVGNSRTFTVMTYTGTRTGTFNTTDFTTAGFDSSEWVDNYGTTGEVRLIFTPVPEPTTILAFIALGGGAARLYRRWRRKGPTALAV